MSTAPPDVIKRELEALLSKALESGDDQHMDELFHVIVDTSNNLRQRYGLPVKIDRTDALSVLKTPTEQLHAAGIGHETVMGHAVFARANAEDAEPHQLCLFDQCFTQPDQAQSCRESVLELVNAHSTLTSVTIYPPLLLRASKDELLLLHIDATGKVRSGHKQNANVILVMFSTGPIVPVVNHADQARTKAFIQNIYGLTGTTNAIDLEHVLLKG